MPVDDRLDLLGMNFLAADIDDAAAPADEDITIATPLHHVAGIDEAVGAADRRLVRAEVIHRGARRTQPQRIVLDLDADVHFRIVAGDERRWKSFPGVDDIEADACFGRGIGVRNRGVGVGGLQGIEHALVRDFAGEPHISGGHGAGPAAHQHAPPV